MDIMYSPEKDNMKNNIVRLGPNLKKHIIKGTRYIKKDKQIKQN